MFWAYVWESRAIDSSSRSEGTHRISLNSRINDIPTFAKILWPYCKDPICLFPKGISDDRSGLADLAEKVIIQFDDQVGLEYWRSYAARLLK